MNDLFTAPLYLLGVLRTPGRSLVEEFHDKAAMMARAREMVLEPRIAFVTMNRRGKPSKQTHMVTLRDGMPVMRATDLTVAARARKPRKANATAFAGLG